MLQCHLGKKKFQYDSRLCSLSSALLLNSKTYFCVAFLLSQKTITRSVNIACKIVVRKHFYFGHYFATWLLTRDFFCTSGIGTETASLSPLNMSWTIKLSYSWKKQICNWNFWNPSVNHLCVTLSGVLKTNNFLISEVRWDWVLEDVERMTHFYI